MKCSHGIRFENKCPDCVNEGLAMEFKSWEELTKVEQLQSTYSDYYKDVHGFRPRGADSEQWNSEEWLTEQIASLDRYIKRMKETFAGREDLREQGWSIPETDPELAKHSRWLQEERDRRYKEMYGEDY